MRRFTLYDLGSLEVYNYTSKYILSVVDFSRLYSRQFSQNFYHPGFCKAAETDILSVICKCAPKSCKQNINHIKRLYAERKRPNQIFVPA